MIIEENKTDIQSKENINKIVHTFYGKIKEDEKISYFFNDVAKVNWDEHLPRMVQFWESVLFGTAAYSGNPMSAHILLHKKSPIRIEHFEQWFKIWTETVDELFKGPNAEKIKKQADQMVQLMWYKINESAKTSFIQ